MDQEESSKHDLTDEQFLFIINNTYTRKHNFTEEEIKTIKDLFPFDNSMDPKAILQEFGKAANECYIRNVFLLNTCKKNIIAYFNIIKHQFGKGWKDIEKYGKNWGRFNLEDFSTDMYYAVGALQEDIAHILNEFMAVLYYVYGGTEEDIGLEYHEYLEHIWKED